LIKEKIKEVEFLIYGEGRDRLRLEAMVYELGLEKQVLFKGRLPLDMLAEEVSKADIGIIPKLDDNFGGEAFSTKTLEFMSMGIPIIVSATRIDRYYFNDSIVRFFKPGDAVDLSIAMTQLIEDADERRWLSKNASEFVKEMSWDVRKSEYLDIVDSLVS
jgi:glycosyltransferase involved in cell wall biosynthesis